MFIKKRPKPQQRGFYMFSTERAGDGLIYVEEQHKCYKFLYVPGAKPFFISSDDFEKSIDKGVLEFVEQLPIDIFNESLMLSSPNKEIIIDSNEE